MNGDARREPVCSHKLRMRLWQAALQDSQTPVDIEFILEVKFQSSKPESIMIAEPTAIDQISWQLWKILNRMWAILMSANLWDHIHQSVRRLASVDMQATTLAARHRGE